MRHITQVPCLLAAAAMLLGPPLHAGDNPSLAAHERGLTRGDSVPDEGSLRIATLAVDVRVHGRIADVTLEARITNSDGDNDEGRFSLVLPPDAVVTGYALDVGGRMIAGQLIDQPKARNVYEDEVRGRIDPGLAEVTEGNRFSTQIYPVRRDLPRRIRLSFAVPLGTTQGLSLPLEISRPVDQMTLDVELSGYSSAPRLAFGGRVLDMTRKGSAWAGSYTVRDGRIQGGLAIDGGQQATPLLLSRHQGDGVFFQVSDVAPIQAAAGPAVGRLRVYWDRSLSRRDDLLAREIDLLAAYIGAVRPEAIDLVTFASDAPTVAVVDSAQSLRNTLKSVVYRGGTHYAALDGLRLPAADQCLLFSDGLVTLDAQTQFRPDCRLSIVASAADAGGQRLGGLAQTSGGQLLRLSIDNHAALLARLLKPTVAVVAVRDGTGRNVPFRALPSQDGGWFVVGEMPDSGELHLSIAGLRRGLTTRSYRASAGDPADADAPAALWASQRVAELADDPVARPLMTSLARQYQVASPTMSFLVLENPGQYVEADIRPPTGFSKEWMQEYGRLRRDRDAYQVRRRDEHLQFVLAQWAQRTAWWNTRFTPVRRKQVAPRAGIAASSSQLTVPAAATAPQVAMELTRGREDARDELSEVVVTGARRVSGPQVSGNPLSVSPRATGKVIKLDVADVLTDQPYLEALDEAAPGKRLSVLAVQEQSFGELPAFYLDTSEWFRLQGDVATSRALLYSALELPAADDETRQIVAFRLQREGQIDRAIAMLERIAVTTDFRPQPKRALALALAERGRAKGRAGRADLERAFELLTAVALEPAIGDFRGIETIALMEANALIPAINAAGGTWALDERLVALLDSDMRIVIEWTADDADIDLWVIEPDGEMVYYGDQTSSSGGQISNDMTDGYGPEEYAIRRAPQGNYQVRIDGYDADRLNPNGNNRVMVRMIRDFGRPGARETLVDAEISFDGNEDDEGGKLIARMKVEGRGGQPQ